MRFVISLLIWVLSTGVVFADGDRAGEFDYYVLALSWSPNWCALEGNSKHAEQCEDDQTYGWVMHGLWPQYEQGGWPSYCRTSHSEATRGQTRAMIDIMGSSGSAWHQWKKHGRCSGLSADVYFDTARRAYRQTTRPAVFRKLTKDIKLPARVVQQAFLEENPQLTENQLTVTCKAGYIQEVRICLSKDLTPRVCGADTIRDCRMDNALFTPIP